MRRFSGLLLLAFLCVGAVIPATAQTPSTRVLIGPQRTYPQYAYLIPGVIGVDVFSMPAELRGTATGSASSYITLDSALVPAKTVTNIGQVFEILAEGRDSSQAHTAVSHSLMINGKVVDSVLGTASVATGWTMHCRVYVRVAGSGLQGVRCFGVDQGTTTTNNLVGARDTLTFDPTAAFNVKVQASDSVAGYTVQTGMTGRLYPIAP